MSSRGFKSPPEGFIRFHGRRKGKPIAPKKLEFYEKYFSQLEYLHEEEWLKKSNRNILDIGFGGGENLAGKVFDNPNVNYVGAEPFINGVASLVYHLCNAKEDLPQNIRIFKDDVKQLFGGFDDGLFDEVHILFPDPWRKKRHTDRRFIHTDNIKQVWRILKKEGLLLVATDDPTYQLHTKDTMLLHNNLFTEIYNSIKQPEGWHPTRYENKALKAGRIPEYHIYKKHN